MATFFKAPAADIDLIEIWSYISQHDFETADRFLERLEETFIQLAKQPFMGRNREDLLPGLRSFTVSNYTVFYRIGDDGVQIARVLNAARDVEAIFGEP